MLICLPRFQTWRRSRPPSAASHRGRRVAVIATMYAVIGLSSIASKPGVAAETTSSPTQIKKKVVVGITAAGRAIGGQYSPFVVDTTGAKTGGATELSTRLSISGHLDSHDAWGKWRVEARLGADLVRGTAVGKESLDGDGMPASTFDTYLPTEAWLGLRYGKEFIVRVGQMTSNWGLGLVANDGRGYMDSRQRDWFVRTETGDRVLRALVLARPFAGARSALAGWMITGAVDKVVADDVLLNSAGSAPMLTLNGRQEEAVQGIVATKLFISKESWFGLYYVYRDQSHRDGNWLKVHAMDAAADVTGHVGGNTLRVRGEAVLIIGKTSLSATPEFPEHDVRQTAIAGQARLTSGHLKIGRLRFELDAAWLSGDNNFDDGTLTGFNADPNYQLGIVLFPRVLAAWSGRGRLTASNPDVVGVPNEDLERLATRGAVTSTLAVFPKIGLALPFGLDIYGGALFAMAPTAIADPFHTKTAGGGQARDALNRAQGASLGIELDVGVRYTLPAKTALIIGAEYGLLLPGDALAGLDTNVHGGRLSLTFAPNVAETK